MVVDFKFYLNKKDSIKAICQERIRRLYCSEKRELARKRFEYEYKMLVKIPDGEIAFLETARYLQKIRNICTSVQGYEPFITFRGAVLSSFIAYLMGIIRDDPLNTDLLPWVFYERKRAIEFNADITIRTYKVISGYEVKLPKPVVLRIGRDSSIIEMVEGCIAYKPKASRSIYDKIRDEIIPVFFNKALCEDQQILRFLTGFDDRFVPHGFSVLEKLKEYGQLPKDQSELSILDGFLHSTLKDSDYLYAIDRAYKCGNGNIYDGLIPSIEAVYHKLRDNGFDTAAAKRIAVIAKTKNRRPGYEDMIDIVYNLGQDYMEMLSNVEHLFSECQCYQNSIREEKIMYLVCNYPDAVSEAYEETCSFM